MIQMVRIIIEQIQLIMKAHSYNPQRSKSNKQDSNSSTVSIVQVSAHADVPQGQTKKVTRTDLPVMLKSAELDLANTICRTHSYYKLIGQAAQADNLFQFFGDIEDMLGPIKVQAGRRRSISRILHAASYLTDPKEEFLNTHMKEYGARICQDLLSGLCIAPEFGYTPWEVIEIPEPSLITGHTYEKQKSTTGTGKSGLKTQASSLKTSK